MVHQYAHAAGDQVAGGIAARVDQQHEEEVELHVGEALAVDLGLQQGRCDVICGICAFARREFRGVGEHLDGPPQRTRGSPTSAGVNDLDQLVEPVAVF